GSGCQSHHDVTIDGRRMMIAACPQTTIQTDGQDVAVALAVSERPRQRPEMSNGVRVADAGLRISRRPNARPAQASADRPQVDAA
ncbi:hypothetical protein QR509_26200, partial [Escherichia coli]|uniref:hypothetical protein n=1 Tax=Escherichia coli TaxID=562 RepID=UPI0027382309